MAKFLDLTGQTYERLTVKKLGPKTKSGMTQWWCECSCGNPDLVLVTVGNIRRGNSKSCGCLDREKLIERSTKHGLRKRGKAHSLAGTWDKMRARCYSEKCKEYQYYGARGIKVCDRWLGDEGLKNFIEDMGEKPSPKHSLERIDNDKDYSPDNCKWATPQEQQSNKSSNVFVLYEGEEITLIEACRRANISYKAVHTRINKLGWTFEKAISTPIRKCQLQNIDGKSLRQLCIERDLPYTQVCTRINKLGWSVEKAINTPIASRSVRTNDSVSLSSYKKRQQLLNKVIQVEENKLTLLEFLKKEGFNIVKVK